MEAQGAAKKKHCGPVHSKREDSLQAWYLSASGTPEGPSSEFRVENPQKLCNDDARYSGDDERPIEELDVSSMERILQPLMHGMQDHRN